MIMHKSIKDSPVTHMELRMQQKHSDERSKSNSRKDFFLMMLERAETLKDYFSYEIMPFENYPNLHNFSLF